MAQLVALATAGRLAEAEMGALQAVARFPDAGPIWKLLGAVQKMQGKDALSAMRQAVDLLPEDALAHSNLGVCLKDLGRIDEAVQCLQRAVALEPTSADGHNNLGVALKAAGRLLEAVKHYRLALHHQPGFDRALNNLGNALRELQQWDEAEACLREAVARYPAYPDAHNNLGNVLRARHLTDDALACFLRALELKPDFAEASGNAGAALRDLGQREQALNYLQRAVQLKPDYAEGWSNLGDALCDGGQYQEALACLQRALTLKPDFAAALTNAALVLRDMNRAKEAQAACLRALQLEPQLTTAQTVLAALKTDSGEFAEAEKWFRKVIAIKPDAAEAWAGLARLRKMRRDDDAWLASVQQLLTARPTPKSEASLQFALGKYYDDVGDYPTAFAHFRRANELARKLGQPYDRTKEATKLAQQLQTQNASWLARLLPAGSASARPIFVVGMPRSGTSLVEQILATHPLVFGAGEQGYWEIAAAHMARVESEREDSTALLGKLAQGYLQLLQTFSADAQHVVDKMPTNFRHLGLIHAAFPRARIIHLQRHPIDICLSIYFRRFAASMSFANDLDDLAHFYQAYEKTMAHWRAVLPPGVLLDVPYEALVQEQETWTRKLLDFVGLPWDARCLDFHETARTVSTASNWQVRQKIHRGSVERWRNYAEFVGALRVLIMEADIHGH